MPDAPVALPATASDRPSFCDVYQVQNPVPPVCLSHWNNSAVRMRAMT